MYQPTALSEAMTIELTSKSSLVQEEDLGLNSIHRAPASTNATNYLRDLGIDGNFFLPSVTTLERIRDNLTTLNRPAEWQDGACDIAIPQLEAIERQGMFGGLVEVRDLSNMVTPQDIENAKIVSPRFIAFIVDIYYAQWSSESLVVRILELLRVEFKRLFFLPDRKTSSDLTLLVKQPHVERQQKQSHYTLIPDCTLRVAGSRTVAVWVETHSSQNHAHEYRMLLALNCQAKVLKLIPYRQMDVRLVGVYISLKLSEPPVRITIFKVPANDDNPITCHSYKMGIGRDGVFGFLKVMYQLLRPLYDEYAMTVNLFGQLSDQLAIGSAYNKLNAPTASSEITCGEATTNDCSTPSSVNEEPPPKKPRSNHGEGGGKGKHGGNTGRGASSSKKRKRRRRSDFPIPWDNIYHLQEFGTIADECQEIIAFLHSLKKRTVLFIHYARQQETYAVGKFVKQRELDITVDLQSIPGVVEVLFHQALSPDTDTHLLVTRYGGVDLGFYARVDPVLIHVPYAVEVVRGLIDTVQALHAAGVAHLDLKPANICVPNLDSPSPIILLDFGSASRIAKPRLPIHGTEGWMAPEAEREDSEADVCRADTWSVGQLLCHLSATVKYSVDQRERSLWSTLGEQMKAFEPCNRLSLEEAKLRLEESRSSFH